MTEEVWKSVVGFEGHYEVSDAGRVRRKSTGRILRPQNSTTGYLHVQLTTNGRPSNKKIHRLVLEAFGGKSGGDAAHQDGNRLNNCFDNLKWMSRKDNCAQKALHKTKIFGDKCHLSRLTERQAKLVLRMSLLGVTDNSIAKFYGKRWGCSEAAIYAIQRGLSWQHLHNGLTIKPNREKKRAAK